MPLTKLQGTIKGFPPSNKRCQWCQKLKHVWGQSARVSGTNLSLVPQAQDRFHPNPFFSGPQPRRAKRNIVEYLGIAADEPNRFGQLNQFKRAPLVENDIDEDLCGLYCQYSDMLAPTYETSCRDGCWFCHNQGIDQLRNLWREYPDLWALLMKWDLDSPVTFKADGHTVHDFAKRFEMEEAGRIPMDATFRWTMLENPPKFVRYKKPETYEQLSLFGNAHL